jgi:metal iron transporter
MSDSDRPVGDEKNTIDASTRQPVDSAERQQNGNANMSWGKAIARQFLAKEPMREAPLVYGGHRQAAEPEKLNPWRIFLKFLTFIGPGVIISMSINDPDNYQQDIQSGQEQMYTQICPLWVAVAIAIYFQVRCTDDQESSTNCLQWLALKLATITGLDLAQANHKWMPRWLELFIYAWAEAAIIAADISAVIGAAFAWNVLIPKLPLAAACVITAADTVIILLFYSPTGTLRNIRYFEWFMCSIVAAMVITAAIAVAQVHPDAGAVFKGGLPSRDMFVGDGLISTCGLIGSTIMPHALYVGSSLARPRLLEHDQKYDLTEYKPGNEPIEVFYRPSLRAIKSTLRYASWELCICIFIIGVFINSTGQIIGASALAESDDFNTLSDLFSGMQSNINSVCATAFAVSLLFSGIGAGTVTTMAGQTVMEGAFQVKINPFIRRFITRCIAIIPALIVCVSLGANGIDNALTACNYIIGLGLVFVVPPVVWYCTHDKFMSVPNDDGTGTVSLKLGIVSSCIAWVLWALLTVCAISTIALMGLNLTD